MLAVVPIQSKNLKVPAKGPWYSVILHRFIDTHLHQLKKRPLTDPLTFSPKPKRRAGSRLSVMPRTKEKSVRKESASSSPESVQRVAVKSDTLPASPSPPRPPGPCSRKASQVAGTCAVVLGLSPPDANSPPPGEPASGTPAKARASPPEDSTFVQARITQRKKQLVDSLMAIIQEWLDNALGPLDEECDGDDSGRPHSSRGGSKASAGDSRRPLAGKKRQLQGSDDEGPPEDEGDDKNGQDRNKKRTKTDSDDSRQRFACPYNKNDPVKWNCGACCGPGFLTWPRLKEHLLRRHRLPTIRCRRCYDCFDSEAALDDHARAEISCPLRDDHKPDPIEGFDSEKEAKLKAPLSGKKTIVERWNDTYRMLFDISRTAEIPTPFQVPGTNRTGLEYHRAYALYLQREFPAVIRREIEDEVDREFSDVEGRMRDKISDMIRNVQVKLFRTWTSITSPEEARALDSPNAATPRARSPSAGPAPPSPDLPPVAAVPPLDSLVDFEAFGLVSDWEPVDMPWDDAFAAANASIGICEEASVGDSGYYTHGSVSTRSAAGQRREPEALF